MQENPVKPNNRAHACWRNRSNPVTAHTHAGEIVQHRRMVGNGWKSWIWMFIRLSGFN